jgi:DNA helicase-2/ATP-dependent DNA helicase PcrA
MVVGDDAQSIYAWRGANYQNILEFPKRYPTAKLYKIETNYRSTPEILEVANAAIKANVHQFPKQLAASRRPGTKPGLVVCMDGAEQALFVVRRVQALCEEGVHPNKIAVLYRSHFHAMELQMELTRQHIPFTITSGIRFFEQAHVKDVAAYLKLVANPKDELAFKRLVQLLPGVARKGADKLWQAYSRPADRQSSGDKKATNAPAGEIAEDAFVARTLQRCAGAVPKKTQFEWTQLVETMAQLEDHEVRDNPSTMIALVLEAGYELYLEESYPNYRSRLEDLTQLADFARQFSNVNDFLTQLALYTNLEGEDEQPAANDEDNIRLSTIHQAKGLEFDAVFIIMLCDGLFPSKRSVELGNADGEEEERRLLYVAITRARNELYLCYPLIRGFSAGGDMGQTPSRFLAEIPKDLLEEWNFSPGWPRQN